MWLWRCNISGRLCSLFIFQWRNIGEVGPSLCYGDPLCFSLRLMVVYDFNPSGIRFCYLEPILQTLFLWTTPLQAAKLYTCECIESALNFYLYKEVTLVTANSIPGLLFRTKPLSKLVFFVCLFFFLQNGIRIMPFYVGWGRGRHGMVAWTLNPATLSEIKMLLTPMREEVR